ncbi:hypothetical protein FKM82_011761 [Ascaphus truei]
MTDPESSETKSQCACSFYATAACCALSPPTTISASSDSLQHFKKRKSWSSGPFSLSFLPSFNSSSQSHQEKAPAFPNSWTLGACSLPPLLRSFHRVSFQSLRFASTGRICFKRFYIVWIGSQTLLAQRQLC